MKSEWVDYAAVQAWFGNLSGNELKRNLSWNIRPQSSQLAEPLWTDPGTKSFIEWNQCSRGNLQHRQGLNGWIFSNNPWKQGKSHIPFPVVNIWGFSVCCVLQWRDSWTDCGRFQGHLKKTCVSSVTATLSLTARETGLLRWRALAVTLFMALWIPWCKTSQMGDHHYVDGVCACVCRCLKVLL